VELALCCLVSDPELLQLGKVRWGIQRWVKWMEVVVDDVEVGEVEVGVAQAGDVEVGVVEVMVGWLLQLGKERCGLTR
jgi:hypothetical protein